jgi:uncharacterized membrane protein YiaA
MIGLEQFKTDIDKIKERNRRVEADKAWERSKTRIFSITAITYIVASIVLYMIGVSNYLLGALIPTVGYFLSTLSLPFLKRWWISRRIKNSQ